MQALGLIETRGLVTAIESADAMLKAADVNLLEKTYVGGGLVSIAITGDVAAVKAAVAAGEAAVKKINSNLLISQHVIPRLHQDLNNVIVSAVPLKYVEISTDVSAKTESQEEASDEIIKEDTAEISFEDKENVTKAIIVEESINQGLLTERRASIEKSALNDMQNREYIDKLVLEYGLNEVIEILSKFKVVTLRNLARQYNNLGIVGRSISKAGKKLLLEEFKKYYEQR